MTPERWHQIADQFEQALELDESARTSFLARIRAEDPDLCREIEILLECDRQNDNTLSDVVQQAAHIALDEQSGDRLGPYRLTKLLGRGGMGSVHLAVRSDDQFHKQVAVKLIRKGLDTEDILQRFRHERQILAHLEHPYIARLLDGGSSPDGRPYLVMEYVDGEPILEYCRHNLLTVEDKLKLFCMVCEAVSYAHRKLVVHRDLKPGNVLVTSDGTTKLLDFGIAKLMSAETGIADMTVGPFRAMTPEYASPEQLRGAPATTATDVYSLGAVLYELLTGIRPHSVEASQTGVLPITTRDKDVEKPSTAVRKRGGFDTKMLSKHLAGDLDNIVLMAMHLEPERRYATAGHLAEDIQRYLDQRPVTAREDTVIYRSSRFLRRNRVAVAAATLVAASLFIGAIVATWQARNAEIQRRRAEQSRIIAEAQTVRAEQAKAAAEASFAEAEKQRTLAMHERARAESEAEHARSERTRADQRSRQLINLANRSLFNLHDQLERTPGATESRRLIVRSTLEYLDQLASEAGDDPRLLQLAASGYYKLGDVLGAPLRPNLGDRNGAMANYKKAEQLLQRLLDHSKWDLAALGPWSQWIETQYRIASLLYEMRQTRESVARHEKALANVQALMARHPKEPQLMEYAGNIHLALTDPLNQIDTRRALENATQAVALFTKAVEASIGKAELVEALATAHGKTASAYLGFGRVKEALPFAEKSALMRERLVAARPTDVLRRRDLMLAYARVGDILGGPQMRVNLGDTRAALAYYGKAVAIAQSLHDADARNKLSRSDLAAALTRAGIASTAPDQHAASLDYLQRAASILDELLREDPNTRRYWLDRTLIYEYIGHRLKAVGDTAGAMRHYEQSLQVAREQLAADPQNNSQFTQMLQAMRAMMELQWEQRDFSAALRLALDVVEKCNAQSPRDSLFAVRWRVRAQLWLGNAYEAIAKSKPSDSQETVQAWRRALEAYESSHSQFAAVSSSENAAIQREEMSSLPERIAQCQAELQRHNARR